MVNQPANPWNDASEKPKSFPILYHTKSGHFGVMLSWMYPAGRTYRSWNNVAHWKAIEVPSDVHGKEAYTAKKLMRDNYEAIKMYHRQVTLKKHVHKLLDLEHPELYKGPGRPLRRLEGQRFGRLTVLSRSTHQPHHNACWTCRCDCGQTVPVTGNNLVRGVTRSCGCLKREHMQRVGFANASTV